MPNPFLNKQSALFQTIQFSMCTYLSKTFQFQVIQFSQTVLMQLIKSGISPDFVHTQLNVKTVLY